MFVGPKLQRSPVVPQASGLNRNPAPPRRMSPSGAFASLVIRLHLCGAEGTFPPVLQRMIWA